LKNQASFDLPKDYLFVPDKSAYVLLNEIDGAKPSSEIMGLIFPGKEELGYRGPRKIAVAGNRSYLWGEQHRIETRTKRNHSRVNSRRLTIGAIIRGPLHTF